MNGFNFLIQGALICTLVFMGSLSANAQLLGWFFNAADGHAVVKGNEKTVPARIMDPNMKSSELSRGAGLMSGASYTRSFFSTFPANAAKIRTEAIKNGTYIEFTLSPKTGKTASLSKLSYKLRTGGINFGYQWAYSTDNWATMKMLGTNQTVLGSISGKDVKVVGGFGPELDLSEQTALQNIGADTTVVFRLYVWGNHTADRNFGIGRSDGAKEGDVVLSVFGETADQ